MENPDEEDDQSFSFTNQENMQLVSDSEEDEHEAGDDDDDDDDDGFYIEIALDPKPSCGIPDHMIQFCLSFSEGSFRRKSLTPAENYTCSSSSSATSSCSSSSSAVLGRSNARRNHHGMMLYDTSSPPKSSENKWRQAVQSLAAQRLVKLLMLNSNCSPDPKSAIEMPDEKCWKLSQRKRSKVRRAINRGLMKLIIRFRPAKAKSNMSPTRPSDEKSGPEHVTYGRNTERKSDKWSRLPEVSISSIKGVIDSLTVSHPSSTMPSPIHRNYCAAETKIYTRENSIKAAIAHCKMSLDAAPPRDDDIISF